MAGSHDTPTGLLLDRYRLDDLLGEGGLGTVYKAWDTRLKRTVAIKTLKRSSATTDPALFHHLEERFIREAEAGARIGFHPNVVSVLDLMTDADKALYLILEFVPGGTLAQRIAEGPLSASDALRLTADAARGLQAAHERGIVHRDVKPQNLFIAEDGRAKVGDFGVAQLDDLSHRTRVAMGHPGTPMYMSPEQERHTQYLRPASDQFSLGLVLFEMVTGKIFRRIGDRAAATLLDGQPELIAAMIRRMLAEHPDNRYPSMTEVVVEAGRARDEAESLSQVITPQPESLTSPEQLVMERPETVRDTVPAPTVTSVEVSQTETSAQPATRPLNLQPPPPVNLKASRPSVTEAAMSRNL